MPEEVNQAVQASEYINIVAIILSGGGGIWLLKVIVQRVVVNSIDWFKNTSNDIQELKTVVAVLKTENVELKSDLKDLNKTVRILTDTSKKQYEKSTKDMTEIKENFAYIKGKLSNSQP